MAIGVENHGPLAVHLLQGVGIQLGLFLTGAGIDLRFLGLHNGKRLAVVVPQDVVAIALAGLGGLMRNLDFLAD